MNVRGVSDVIDIVEDKVVPVDTVHGRLEIDGLDHCHLFGIAKLIDH